MLRTAKALPAALILLGLGCQPDGEMANRRTRPAATTSPNGLESQTPADDATGDAPDADESAQPALTSGLGDFDVENFAPMIFRDDAKQKITKRLWSDVVDRDVALSKKTEALVVGAAILADGTYLVAHSVYSRDAGNVYTLLIRHLSADGKTLQEIKAPDLGFPFNVRFHEIGERIFVTSGWYYYSCQLAELDLKNKKLKRELNDILPQRSLLNHNSHCTIDQPSVADGSLLFVKGLFYHDLKGETEVPTLYRWRPKDKEATVVRKFAQKEIVLATRVDGDKVATLSLERPSDNEIVLHKNLGDGTTTSVTVAASSLRPNTKFTSAGIVGMLGDDDSVYLAATLIQSICQTDCAEVFLQRLDAKLAPVWTRSLMKSDQNFYYVQALDFAQGKVFASVHYNNFQAGEKDEYRVYTANGDAVNDAWKTLTMPHCYYCPPLDANLKGGKAMLATAEAIETYNLDGTKVDSLPVKFEHEQWLEYAEFTDLSVDAKGDSYFFAKVMNAYDDQASRFQLVKVGADGIASRTPVKTAKDCGRMTSQALHRQKIYVICESTGLKNGAYVTRFALDGKEDAAWAASIGRTDLTRGALATLGDDTLVLTKAVWDEFLTLGPDGGATTVAVDPMPTSESFPSVGSVVPLSGGDFVVVGNFRGVVGFIARYGKDGRIRWYRQFDESAYIRFFPYDEESYLVTMLPSNTGERASYKIAKGGLDDGELDGTPRTLDWSPINAKAYSLVTAGLVGKDGKVYVAYAEAVERGGYFHEDFGLARIDPEALTFDTEWRPIYQSPHDLYSIDRKPSMAVVGDAIVLSLKGYNLVDKLSGEDVWVQKFSTK